jgi:hypothetical protein
MTHHLHILVDEEIYRHVERHAREIQKRSDPRGRPNVSAAARDLLRAALGVVDSPHDAGWREGYTAAFAEAQRRLNEVFAGLAPPGE